MIKNMNLSQNTYEGTILIKWVTFSFVLRLAAREGGKEIMFWKNPAIKSLARCKT